MELGVAWRAAAAFFGRSSSSSCKLRVEPTSPSIVGPTPASSQGSFSSPTFVTALAHPLVLLAERLSRENTVDIHGTRDSPHDESCDTSVHLPAKEGPPGPERGAVMPCSQLVAMCDYLPAGMARSVWCIDDYIGRKACKWRNTYAATCKHSGAQVLLRFVPPWTSSNGDGAQQPCPQQVATAARFVTGLRHPHVLLTYAVFVEREHLVVVHEHVDGASLSTLVGLDGMAERDAVGLVLEPLMHALRFLVNSGAEVCMPDMMAFVSSPLDHQMLKISATCILEMQCNSGLACGIDRLPQALGLMAYRLFHGIKQTTSQQLWSPQDKRLPFSDLLYKHVDENNPRRSRLGSALSHMDALATARTSAPTVSATNENKRIVQVCEQLKQDLLARPWSGRAKAFIWTLLSMPSAYMRQGNANKASEEMLSRMLQHPWMTFHRSMRTYPSATQTVSLSSGERGSGTSVDLNAVFASCPGRPSTGKEPTSLFVWDPVNMEWQLVLSDGSGCSTSSVDPRAKSLCGDVAHTGASGDDQSWEYTDYL